MEYFLKHSFGVARRIKAIVIINSNWNIYGREEYHKQLFLCRFAIESHWKFMFKTLNT